MLYEKVDNPSVIADKLQLAVEDISLPPHILVQLENDLQTSNTSLPDLAKNFLPVAAMGNWKVALLDRVGD